MPALSLLFFFAIERSVLMALVFYNKGLLKMVTRQKPQQFSDFPISKKTQLNAEHTQLLEKLRPLAFAETCRFLTIQSLEFQDIWQKKKKSLKLPERSVKRNPNFDKGNRLY